MPDTQVFAPGGYRFIPAVFQYSSGVAALEGFAIRRVRFSKGVPLARGFALIEQIMQAAGRPPTAFCACELRSPGQVSDAGFRAFNMDYVARLKAWGLTDGVVNPVARSNVCPEGGAAPADPVFHAFCYTVPEPNAAPSFVIAGSGEAREGEGSYAERAVRLGETGPDAMREKAVFVLNEMERRLAAFGRDWRDTTACHVYTVYDIFPFLEPEIVARGAAHAGVDWHFCRPPVLGLEFEMDCRAVYREEILAVA